MSESLSLYTLEQELMETFEQVQDLQAEGNEEDLAAALGALESYIKESVSKRDRCGKFLQSLVTTEATIQYEIERLQERKKRIIKTREAMEKYILLIMSHIGVKKLEGQLFSFKARQNPPSVVIEDESRIPDEYKRQPPTPDPVPDKRLIKDALLNEVNVPGAALRQETRLVIDQ